MGRRGDRRRLKEGLISLSWLTHAGSQSQDGGGGRQGCDLAWMPAKI